MSDSHQTVLGFEAGQAIAALTRLAQVQRAYTASVTANANALKSFNKVAKQTDVILSKNSKSWSNAAAAVQKFQRAASGVSTVTPALENVQEQSQKVGSQLTLTWKSMARIFTIQALHGAISNLTTLLSNAVEEARAFGIAIAEVETIAGPLGLTFDKLAAQARGVAEAIGAPLDVVAEAQYQLYSNQVGGAVESTLALEAASKLSLAAVTSLNDAVGVVTGVMNSYGISAARAEEISAKLFRTVELGRVRAAELANTLGRTTVIAAQLGVQYEEVLASIATMTIQGQKASDAQTRLTQVMLKLIKPTDAMKEAYKELGVVSAEAGIQAFGFQGFLEKLRETTNGSVTEFAELFGRVRATAGALGLTGKAADRYRENLEKINETTTDLLDLKVEIIMRTNAKQVEKELNTLHVQTIETFGRGLNELLGDLFRFFGGAVNTMRSLATIVGVASATFLAMRFNAISAFKSVVVGAKAGTLSMAGFGASIKNFAKSPAVLATAAALATTAIVKMFVTTQEEANKTLDLLDNVRDEQLADQLKAQDIAFKAQQKEHKKIISATQKFLIDVVKLNEQAREQTANLEQRATSSLNNQLSNRASALQSFINQITGMADGLESKLKELDKSSKAVADNVADFKFGRELKDLNDVRKVHALIERSQELRSRSTAALNKGEAELAASLRAQAESYAKQGLQIADQLKNRGLTSRAEQEVELAMRQQQTINFGLGKQAETNKEAIEAQLAPLSQQFSLFQQLTAELKAAEFEFAKGRKTAKERAAIEKDRTRIAGELKTVIANIAKQEGLAEQLGLNELLDQITKTFREGITGKEMDLSELVAFDSEILASKLQVSLEDAVQKKLDKILIIFDAETPEQVVEALTQLPKQAEAANEAAKENIITVAEQKRLYGDVLETMVSMREALESQFSVWENIASVIPGIQPGSPGAKLQKQYAAMEAELLSFNEVADRTSKLILFGDTADIPQIKSGIQQIRDMAAALKEAGDPASAKAALAAAKAAKLLTEGLGRLIQLDAPTGDLDTTNQKIQELGQSMTGSAENISTATTSINSDITSIKNNAIDAVRALAQLRLGQSGAVTASHGAMYLAGGGFTPRGTDRIAAMLSRGESVNTADSTRRFASQIQAMNAGVTPVYRDAGGTVSVGDVNISVQGAPTPEKTAREVMTAFRREMRRKTSTF
jgi:TP901 family phage tail tape measure protein